MARDDSFDLDLNPKCDGQIILTKSGQIKIYCRFHPGTMTTLVVDS